MRSEHPWHHRFAWSIFVAALALAGTGHARASDWFYSVRPHDTIWALAGRYLKPSVPWQKLQAYNKVTDPYHLPPGMRLRIPVEWLQVQPAKATVAALHGSAQVVLPGHTAASAATVGMRLGYGARIDTSANASLTLEFADGSRVLMEGGSELVLDRMSAYGRTGMADTHLRLQHGRIVNVVTPMPGNTAHFVVQTPSATSSVRGTHFRVAAGDGYAQTEVTKGRVDVAGQRHHALVPRGFGVEVTQGQQPGRVRRLLPAPVLDCPQQPVIRPGATLDWQALAGAVRYRVEIAPNARFETLLLNRVTGALPHADIPDLPNGTYALRVHGIDTVGLEGMDATCTLHTAMHPQPPLVQAPQAGARVRARRPAFRWTDSSEAVAYAWQLAGDPQFRHPLETRDHVASDHLRAATALPLGRYYWRIASIDRSGQQGPYSAAIAFDRVLPPPAPRVGAPRRSGHELTLGWSAGSPGQHYRIQLARDPDFAHPQVDRTLDRPALQIRKPGDGTWYVRVRTIDTDGYAGRWGTVQKIHLPCIACRIVAGVGGGTVLLWLLL